MKLIKPRFLGYPSIFVGCCIVLIAGYAKWRAIWTAPSSRSPISSARLNAKIGDAQFDAENDGEFNAVETVEALPDIQKLQRDKVADGSGSQIVVGCGAGPDHGRSFWVVYVYLVDRAGRYSILRSYNYDIYQGSLKAAATEPT